jgi:cyclopropane fatty-acyl-phospholipid synthase-like methyltransferase
MFFDQYNEFVEFDSRKDRPTAPVSSETLERRFEVMLPEWLVSGKRILDIGSALGAAGHWCLSKGATSYTGVEIQDNYRLTSHALLSKYWNDFDLVKTLDQIDGKYDIVLAAGVIHGFFDPYQTIKTISKFSSSYILIETVSVEDDVPKIILAEQKMINQNDVNNPFSGWTSLPNQSALSIIMKENGFIIDGEPLFPKRTSAHDAYNDATKDGFPMRYIVRYKKHNTKLTKLEDSISTDTPGNVPIGYKKFPKVDKWSFDDAVAERFQQEATTNIPDYDRVISLCIDIAKRHLHSDDFIIDVGSALGYTVDRFIDSGFTCVLGVECSESMYKATKHPERIIHSDTFPNNITPRMVLANWTLHFVIEREQYVKDVYDNLTDDGVFILTDKTPQSTLIKNLYYDFKRANGVSDEYIYEKEQKLKGYMHLYSIEWYLETLTKVGFKNVQIINSNLGFVTFYAEK